MKCEGLPNLPCGRTLSGSEGWCLQHGDREDREARWAMSGLVKSDVDPLIGAKRERLPMGTMKRPHELQRALAGMFEEDE